MTVDEHQHNQPLKFTIDLPPAQEVGVFADFANVWHTPATFVMDFLSVKGPAQAVTDDKTGESSAMLRAGVAARVRIPAEQIFPLMEALKAQSQKWLAETGRIEPPETWLPHSDER